MIDINKHKFFLVQVLKDIYSDIELASLLGFKGGTALMLFYGLSRFSVDLDFNLIDEKKSKIVYEKLRTILQKYGRIKDEASKHFALLLVLDYGENERNLKLEVSNRKYNDSYEMLSFLGINMLVMIKSDMFSHKLCALTDRNIFANRDIFDCYFFMQQRTPVNRDIIENRMKMSFEKYIDKCIETLETISNKNILYGMGELIDNDMKTFVKTKLLSETIILLKMYKNMPF